MSTYRGNENFRHGLPDVIGVLLSNLGTPDDCTSAATRRYLAEFLSDPRVVEMPRWLWRVILHGVVLRVRPARAAHAYRRVWMAEGAPLLVISQRQAQALEEALAAQSGPSVRVALGMRYGRPSIAAALAALRDAGARRILVLPLYPQYSSATTASTFDAVSRELATWRWLPELRMVTHYHDDPWYVSAVAGSLRDAWRSRERPERVLFSFHGMPLRTLHAGDPYFCQCQKTARAVAEELQLDAGQWAIAFQSRFGREKWLQPYTDVTLRSWGHAGVRSVDVVCPGFSADCMETLEEVAMLNRDNYLKAGGREFHYVPALNDRPEHIAGLVDLIRRHTAGWSTERPAAEAEESRRRALALGARQ